jgi:hypothetical protein
MMMSITSVVRKARGARENGQRQRREDVKPELVDKRERDEVAQGEGRADAEIDAAGDHHDRDADGDELIFAEHAAKVRQARKRKELRGEDAEQAEHQRQNQHRYRGVDPGLGEDFADHVIGDVAVAQAGP